MSVSTILTSTRGFVRSSAFLAATLAITVALFGASAFADGESLAETGGYVPTDAPALAFKNITLADLGVTVFPSVSKGGGWAGGEARVPLLCRTEVKDGDVLQSVSYQAQWFDGGYLKCATITFTGGIGGVYAQTTAAKYIGSGVDAAYGTDFSGGTVGSVADSASSDGYGFHSLALHTAADIDSININFNADESHKMRPRTTSTAVGPGDYAIEAYGWSQMVGSNNNTLNGVIALGSENDENFYASCASVVTVTGTRGTYSYGGYDYTSDVRYGYIDEDANNTTPTVTITNIPFDYYKVVFIPSTDTEDSKFGYITVNSRRVNPKNYSSVNTEKASDRDYDLAVDSTAAWGLTRVADYLHGVNYLVTPVLANYSGKTLTVTGHKSNGRGCIAAIQIVKAEQPETFYSATISGDVTWSTKAGLTGISGTWASGNTIQLVNNQATPVTVTFDETVDSGELILSGSGTTIIQFGDASYNQIATFNFDDVSGEVVLDDYMQTISFTPPATGAVRYKGVATLATVPCASGAIPYTVIVDQPLTVSEFALAGVKSDYRFGDDFVGTFTRFVLGNDSGSNQKVTQLGGSIVVNGDSEPSTGNQSSVLLGHWGNLTVQLNTYGGTFTAENAASRLGHTGKCYWTIGDGESADDGTAVANLKGIVNQNGVEWNGGVGSKVTLQQGGTLNLGESGIAIPNSYVEFAGGKLATSHSSNVSVSASSVTAVAETDTEINTVNGLTIVSAISGGGGLTKTGTGTLTLSAPATATGTLTINAGTVKLNDGVTWAGTISVGANGTLDITDADVSESETVYIHVGGTLTLAEGATVKLNGAAINAEVWELSGGTFVNKTLNTAVTTATGDFGFSAATWESALGAGATIDWAGSLSEVRVHANNTAPATATIDVTAADVDTFAVDGTGDMTFIAANGGSVSADIYDFSQASGRVEYGLTTGSGTVVAGSDTVLTQNGNGTLNIAAGTKLTLAAPWGTVDGNTATYTGGFTPKDRSTLIIAPGEGMIQKTTQNVLGQYQLTTIAVSNGTLAVNVANGGTGYFAGNSVRIDDGGVISLEVQDASGYSQTAAPITVNAGGTLAVKVRDTLRRPLVMNGGTVTVQGQESGRALDLYDNDTITVTANSTIQAIDDGTVQNPIIAFRKNTTVINIDDGISLVNNVTYGTSESGTVTIRGTMNHGNGNGSMVMNGFNGNPLVFTGLATIGESGKPVMYVLNCEHRNGAYVVNAASRFKGTGSVTGNGGVTLVASNSKLCGSLTVNNLTAASGGTYGDQWNTVSAKVATSYFAAGTQTIENGSFTIGADCVVTNSEGTADTTAATFSIAANGNLKLEKSVTVAGLTVSGGGTITLVAASKNSVPAINVASDTSYAGNVNFIMDFGSASAPGGRTYTLMTGTLPNLANVSVSDGRGEKKWKVFIDGGALKASSSGSFSLRLR
ncbi:MAG: hypothetical protein IJG18_11380 [Kiritimatiellae bacterium]|nr:hypothetical protein [Kiritimatiellia bacterium]